MMSRTYATAAPRTVTVFTICPGCWRGCRKRSRLNGCRWGLAIRSGDNLAKAYYALQSTGDQARLDPLIFEAIHKEGVSLYDEESITAWVGKHGVNVAQFTAAYRSFGVNTSVGQAQQNVIDYRVDGVPTLAIGGRYKVSEDHNKMLAVADELIAKARAEKKTPKR
jgi:thiol:disulfide interchange protein DsbA